MQLADPSLPRGPSKQLHVDAGFGGRSHAPSQQYCSAWGGGWSRGTAARQGDPTAFLAGVSASRPAPPRRFGRLLQNCDATPYPAAFENSEEAKGTVKSSSARDHQTMCPPSLVG